MVGWFDSLKWVNEEKVDGLVNNLQILVRWIIILWGWTESVSNQSWLLRINLLRTWPVLTSTTKSPSQVALLAPDVRVGFARQISRSSRHTWACFYPFKMFPNRASSRKFFRANGGWKSRFDERVPRDPNEFRKCLLSASTSPLWESDSGLCRLAYCSGPTVHDASDGFLIGKCRPRPSKYPCKSSGRDLWTDVCVSVGSYHGEEMMMTMKVAVTTTMP